MSEWTALVPFKGDASSKSRLAEHLSEPQRIKLAQNMAANVITALRHTPAIREIVILSPIAPPWSDVIWAKDEGSGLNNELQAWRNAFGSARTIIVFADLPLLNSDDVGFMLELAERSRVSIAPDKHGSGTNAIAFAEDTPIALAFGPDSFTRHKMLWPNAAVVQRPGLATDVDTITDLEALACLPPYAEVLSQLASQRGAS